MYVSRRFLIVVVAVAGLALAACGNGNPASPSGMAGVTVRGVLLGETAAFSKSSTDGPLSSPITVVVEGTSISATISANGTWELDDIAPGTFTLLFFQEGTEIGEINITAGDGVEVEIIVKVEGSAIVVVKMEFQDDDEDDDDEDGHEEDDEDDEDDHHEDDDDD